MHDVIIVGAGVAGSYLAGKLADLDVLVLEKNKIVIMKDSGIVSSRFMSFFREKELIKSDIREMKAVSPSGISISLKSRQPFAHILDREKFLRFLRAGIRKNIRYETARKVVISSAGVTVYTDKTGHQARLVVGCDGANSVVRKAAGIKAPKTAAGIMVKAGLEGGIKVYFNKYFSPDFFSWTMNGEYGLMTAVNPLDYFNYFRQKMQLPDGEVHAAPIPVGYTKSFSERCLLVGDACGQVKPLSGGGIIFSLAAAGYAADTIRAALRGKKFGKGFLSSYERAWKNDFGSEIRKQLLFRKIYRKLTNRDIDALFMDFGQSIATLGKFDYDRLSGIWTKMPKLKLAKHLILGLLRLF